MSAATTLLIIIPLFLFLCSLPTGESEIGVCYGMIADNLPCPEDVVKLYQKYSIGAMRLYEPEPRTLKALQGTSIKLMLGVRNQDIPIIGCNQSAANEWVNTNVVPYAKSIKYIAVGNEIKPNYAEASSVEPAMQNIQNSLNSNGLKGQIMVSTAIDPSLTKNTYPPSHSEFINLTYITPIINFLTNNDSPLLININPYDAYVNDPEHITLDYALFTACGTVFTDDKTGKEYQNLFDASYDAMYIAIEKVVATESLKIFDKNKKNGFKNPTSSESRWSSKSKFHHHSLELKGDTNVQRNEAECGWPKGGEAATIENAKTFYTNMINHVKKGTPLTLGQEIEVYLFAMFDENLKPDDESERNSGLFTPNGEPKYGILNFTAPCQ